MGASRVLAVDLLEVILEHVRVEETVQRDLVDDLERFVTENREDIRKCLEVVSVL